MCWILMMIFVAITAAQHFYNNPRIIAQFIGSFYFDSYTDTLFFRLIKNALFSLFLVFSSLEQTRSRCQYWNYCWYSNQSSVSTIMLRVIGIRAGINIERIALHHRSGNNRFVLVFAGRQRQIFHFADNQYEMPFVRPAFVFSQLKKEDEDGVIAGDWKFAAMVVDRLCLIIFTLFTIIATLFVLFSAPNFLL